MELPENITEEIKKQKLDEQDTKQLSMLTINIDKTLKQEENSIISIYKKLNAINTKLNSLSTVDGNYIMEELTELYNDCNAILDETDKLLVTLIRIKSIIQEEEEEEQKKISIKLSIESDIEEEKKIIKKIDYGRDVKKILKEIINEIKDSRKLTKKDEDIEQQTFDFITNTIKIIQNAEIVIKSLRDNIRNATNIEKIKSLLAEVVNDINIEIEKINQLDDLQKIHIGLLLNIYKDESKAESLEETYEQKQEIPEEDGAVIKEDFI